MFYLKAKIYAPEGQEALTKLTEKKMETSDKKEEWRKKLGISSEMYTDTHTWEKNCCV